MQRELANGSKNKLIGESLMPALLPESVAPFAGKILDVDTHCQMPAQVWAEAFGEVMKPWADRFMSGTPNKNNPNDMNVPDYRGDVAELDPKTLWTKKGPTAPSAVDMRRRGEVMDLMSIKRQLLFPTGQGTTLYSACPDGTGRVSKWFGERTREYGKQIMDAHNKWAVANNMFSDRLRPVATVYGDTPEALISMTRVFIHQGIRAVQVPVGTLPGGISPASDELDEFYAILAEANVPITLHLGGEPGFFATLGWGDARAFKGFKQNDEGNLDPWTLSSYHLPAQNYVATMVTGGVFDRHPTLRVGVMEYCAHWIGPLAEYLDMWHDNNQAMIPVRFADGKMGRRLPMRPSEYIARNVRVAPFDFEPVGHYIQKYGLEDVFCFASDYPHVEGGKDPIGKFAASLEPLGAEVMEKFFVTNGELLLPA